MNQVGRGTRLGCRFWGLLNQDSEVLSERCVYIQEILVHLKIIILKVLATFLVVQTCYPWDIWSEWWHMTWPTKRQRQRRVLNKLFVQEQKYPHCNHLLSPKTTKPPKHNPPIKAFLLNKYSAFPRMLSLLITFRVSQLKLCRRCDVRPYLKLDIWNPPLQWS